MRPQPEPRRYKRASLQAAYEAGFHQEYDHDSFAFLDRLDAILDSSATIPERAADPGLDCELRAAALRGAADALMKLADAQRGGAMFVRAWDRGGDPA